MSTSPSPESWDDLLVKELEQQKAAGLIARLKTASTMSCEQARELLPALVKAERAGQDTDAMGDFAVLLSHLDACPDCMARYMELWEEAELEEGALPEVATTALPPPVTVRANERVVVSIQERVANWFRLLLLPPALPQPGVQAASTQGLIGGIVSEVEAQPLVSVSLQSSGEFCDLLVAAKVPDRPIRWRVHVAAGELRRSAVTDPDGRVRFAGLRYADLEHLTLTFEPLTDAPASDEAAPSV